MLSIFYVYPGRGKKMEKRFYDFCKKERLIGTIWVEPMDGRIVFNVKYGNYGASHAVSEENIKMAEENNFDLFGFVFESLLKMISNAIANRS